MKPELTYKLCMAAGQDAGNRSMRKAGRKQWNIKDHAVACDEANRLLHKMDPERYPKLSRE